MRWRSRGQPVEKLERAELLLLALAALLLRGGERVRLIGSDQRAGGGRAALDRLAAALPRLPERRAACRRRCACRGTRAWCCSAISSRRCRKSRRRWRGWPRCRSPARCCRCSIRPRRCCPTPAASASGGWSARRTRWCRGWRACGRPMREALERQQQGLAAICAAAGFGFVLHRTDQPAEAALLGLYTALAGHVTGPGGPRPTRSSLPRRSRCPPAAPLPPASPRRGA